MATFTLLVDVDGEATTIHTKRRNTKNARINLLCETLDDFKERYPDSFHVRVDIIKINGEKP